ncbi:hypothetical protein RBU61_14355 [Tissierella sp. MB52-C2]|uniref:hypothetical protein n=1 Tax=Tissierella sp. MB52-C2 TaxID=3070999 RepID=UPI00280B0B6F|nr:hypothetical protein [Tissierella sp. MB52-C2]WMM24097.1 hypothetical protein RBU61_14355 [Tissierella sp. MB52-C2]
MRQKSKFITFILSFLPGLSHFYLGYADRGLIYLIILGMLGAGSIGLTIMLGNEGPVIIGMTGACVLWLVALVDAFSVANSLRYNNSAEIKDGWNSEETKDSNKKIITLALSIIPGAGHMYLGYQRKGLVLMGGFFFAIFFMGWLNLSFLLFLLPLIWFYSFFDAFHTLNGNKVEEIDIEKLIPVVKTKYIGMGLIGIGIIVGFQRIIHPLLNQYIEDYIVNYIQTSIVSLIFIFAGIKMLKKREVEIIEEDEDHEN